MLLLRDVSKECTATIFRVWVKITQHHNTKTQSKSTARHKKQKKTKTEAITGTSSSRRDTLLYCDWQWVDEWSNGVNYSVDSQYLIALSTHLTCCYSLLQTGRTLHDPKSKAHSEQNTRSICDMSTVSTHTTPESKPASV